MLAVSLGPRASEVSWCVCTLVRQEDSGALALSTTMFQLVDGTEGSASKTDNPIVFESGFFCAVFGSDVYQLEVCEKTAAGFPFAEDTVGDAVAGTCTATGPDAAMDTATIPEPESDIDVGPLFRVVPGAHMAAGEVGVDNGSHDWDLETSGCDVLLEEGEGATAPPVEKAHGAHGAAALPVLEEVHVGSPGPCVQSMIPTRAEVDLLTRLRRELADRKAASAGPSFAPTSVPVVPLLASSASGDCTKASFARWRDGSQHGTHVNSATIEIAAKSMRGVNAARDIKRARLCVDDEDKDRYHTADSDDDGCYGKQDESVDTQETKKTKPRRQRRRLCGQEGPKALEVVLGSRVGRALEEVVGSGAGGAGRAGRASPASRAVEEVVGSGAGRAGRAGASGGSDGAGGFDGSDNRLYPVGMCVEALGAFVFGVDSNKQRRERVRNAQDAVADARARVRQATQDTEDAEKQVAALLKSHVALCVETMAKFAEGVDATQLRSLLLPGST